MAVSRSVGLANGCGLLNTADVLAGFVLGAVGLGAVFGLNENWQPDRIKLLAKTIAIKVKKMNLGEQGFFFGIAVCIMSSLTENGNLV